MALFLLAAARHFTQRPAGSAGAEESLPSNGQPLGHWADMPRITVTTPARPDAAHDTLAGLL
ncbi:hypothetical protein OG889_02445 [Streptomyces sp. NBC_00481]|uniref:hypothetical protein n=1 Tax=unclassified Streptomyces TaxID=2593676 RepID=UPI002DD9BBD1|nr:MULTISPECIES: hypothetical protein [unclassified Streptomyces]WRY93678.1 hypothetical protein OG889_02445 [Streptomyces sp. NBC_00481]